MMIRARACERSVSGAENGAEPTENRVKRSGAERVWQKMMERELSANREVTERERGGERGLQK